MDMDQETRIKLLFELRSRVNDLSAAIQLLTPLVKNHGRSKDVSCLQVMQKSLHRLLRTIDHLELFGEPVPLLHLRSLDLIDICQTLSREVDSVTRDLGTDFQWNMDAEEIETIGDKQLLKKAILNLLLNGFQAAGEGGHVRFRCSVKEGMCFITVEDDGPGLPVPRPHHDPYELTSEGAGLGLPIARKIASLHGGTIMLENMDPHGVRAVMSLPVRIADSESILCSPMIGFGGGFSLTMVEFSPLLPMECFRLRGLN